MNHAKYMQIAFEQAFNGVRDNLGGPFGAVVVQNDEIIGKGCNMVASTNDPSAHAEIVAIREACTKVSSFHLDNAVIYATCEPCPMCLSAIYWANIKKIYYCSDRVDAEKIGFSDKFIYDEFSKNIEDRSIKIERMVLPYSVELFDEWVKKTDRVQY